MKKVKAIYLSGQIDGITLGQAREWRSLAAQRLTYVGYQVLDPTQKIHKKFLTPKRMMDLNYLKLEDTAQGIVRKDMTMMRRADVMLCNLSGINACSGEEAPAGSLMELFWFFRVLKRPTFVVCDVPAYLRRPWIDGHTTQSFPSLDKAIRYLIQQAL